MGETPRNPHDAAVIALDLYTIAERLEDGDSIGDLPLGWSGTFARLRQAADALRAAAPLPDTAAPQMDDEAFAWLMAAVEETEASDTAAADEKRGAAWIRANVLAAGGAGVAHQLADNERGGGAR